MTKTLIDWTQMQVSNRRFVALAYELSLEDGEVIDSSSEDDPLTFVFGFGQVIPGLEKKLEGMSEGEKKKVVVEAKEAYGEHMDALIQHIPRKSFPKDVPLEAGLMLTAETPEGDANFMVLSATDDDVEVDFNHPLAGKRLHFDVTVVTVRELTEEEAEVIDKYEKQQREQAAQGSCASCSSSGCCGSTTAGASTSTGSNN